MKTYLISDGQKKAWEIVFKEKSEWMKAKKPQKPDFIYGNLKVEGKVMPFSNDKLSVFHKKDEFFTIMKAHRVSCIPETYDSIKEFDKYRKNNGALWFYKLASYDCGSGIT